MKKCRIFTTTASLLIIETWFIPVFVILRRKTYSIYIPVSYLCLIVVTLLLAVVSLGTFLWVGLDQCSQYTLIMALQRNSWILALRGFVSSLRDAPWSMWSWINDLVPAEIISKERTLKNTTKFVVKWVPCWHPCKCKTAFIGSQSTNHKLKRKPYSTIALHSFYLFVDFWEGIFHSH